MEERLTLRYSGLTVRGRYLRFFQDVTGVDTTDEAFIEFIEIKATRDLLVHNGGIINEIYEQKAGDMSRGVAGKRISVDCEYFDFCISTMKQVSVIIAREIQEKFD